MNVSIVTAKVKRSDKIEFDKFCESVGINTSTAINMFIKTVLRDRAIPFVIQEKKDPFYSDTNMSYLLKSIEQLEAGNGKSHELIEG